MISEIHISYSENKLFAISYSENKLFAELRLFFPERAGRKYENWCDMI